ncbi:3-oxoacyl-ACP reductase, partial [Burkholderia cenocepacia]
MQSTESNRRNAPAILLVAASRGPGLAMAEAFLNKGWNV